MDHSLKSEMALHLQEAIDEEHRRRHDPGRSARRRLRAFGPVARLRKNAATRGASPSSSIWCRICATRCDRSPGSRCSSRRRCFDRGRDRREHHDLQPRDRAVAVRPHAPQPERSCTSGWAAAAMSRTGSGGSSTERRARRDSPATPSRPRSTGAAPGQSISLMPLIVTANFFDVLGGQWRWGGGSRRRRAGANAIRRCAVISHGFWQTAARGDPSVIGAR